MDQFLIETSEPKLALINYLRDVRKFAEDEIHMAVHLLGDGFPNSYSDRERLRSWYDKFPDTNDFPAFDSESWMSVRFDNRLDIMDRDAFHNLCEKMRYGCLFAQIEDLRKSLELLKSQCFDYVSMATIPGPGRPIDEVLEKKLLPLYHLESQCRTQLDQLAIVKFLPREADK